MLPIKAVSEPETVKKILGNEGHPITERNSVVPEDLVFPARNRSA